MQRVTFGQFLQNATQYERTPVDIDPGLRRGVWLGLLMTVIYGVIYYYLPDSSLLRNSIFFHWTKVWLAEVWDFVAINRHIFLSMCALMFLLTLLLLVVTRGFRTAEIIAHIALFVPVVLAALNMVFLLILLLPVFVNLFVWLCLAVAVLLGGVILLGGLLWMISH